MNKSLVYSLLLGLFVAAPALAAETAQTRDQYQLQQKDMYGWELMTPEERAAHREKMQNMRTESEREQYRMEHHERMEERAKAKGIELPDTPRSGHGPGMGGGAGGGKGGGMGGGKY